MAQVIAGNLPAVQGRGRSIALWVLQVAAALMFLIAGGFKLAGAEKMVGLFATIGIGQWFRYLTGALEVLGALALLTPSYSGWGALLLTGVLIGAVLTHLFVVGGSPAIALMLLVVSAIVAWGRREQLKRF